MRVGIFSVLKPGTISSLLRIFWEYNHLDSKSYEWSRVYGKKWLCGVSFEYPYTRKKSGKCVQDTVIHLKYEFHSMQYNGSSVGLGLGGFGCKNPHSVMWLTGWTWVKLTAKWTSPCCCEYTVEKGEPYILPWVSWAMDGIKFDTHSTNKRAKCKAYCEIFLFGHQDNVLKIGGHIWVTIPWFKIKTTAWSPCPFWRWLGEIWNIALWDIWLNIYSGPPSVFGILGSFW